MDFTTAKTPLALPITGIEPPRSDGNILQKGLSRLRYLAEKTWYSNKMRFLLLFFLMLVCVNFMLIYFNYMNISSSIILGDPSAPGYVKPTKLQRAMSSIGNSLYFTTTQITTIGYGDVTPNTTIGKACVTLAHVVIGFIALNLAAEYGANNTQKDMIASVVSKALGATPERRRTRFGDDLRNSIAGVVVTDPIKTFEQTVEVADKVENTGSLIKTKMRSSIDRARSNLEKRKNAIIPDNRAFDVSEMSNQVSQSNIGLDGLLDLNSIPAELPPPAPVDENGSSLLS